MRNHFWSCSKLILFELKILKGRVQLCKIAMQEMSRHRGWAKAFSKWIKYRVVVIPYYKQFGVEVSSLWDYTDTRIKMSKSYRNKIIEEKWNQTNPRRWNRIDGHHKKGRNCYFLSILSRLWKNSHNQYSACHKTEKKFN
jgi:hypothetical protein